jgi:hypothetical protein
MKHFFLHPWLALAALLLSGNSINAQNPIVRDQFSADPSARVFNNRVYVFPSHDILANENRGRIGWFCMEDYHVFSSANLTDWTDHGVIVSQNGVSWVDSTSYSMWAPDCIERDGRYYFYFPAGARNRGRRGFGIGVAVADRPEGPYIPQDEPIANMRGIDPNVFIDRDGQAYIYSSMGNIFVARMKENMLELASELKVVDSLPRAGLKEGPYVFERNGIYYMTYPHVQDKTERLEYAMGDNPMGPFTVTGVIMDESPSGCWTNHHSVIEFRDQWYLFYHDQDLSPKFDKVRSIRVDSLFFNPEGTIRKVVPTLRGVGITAATGEIQLDRYSGVSDQGASVAFLDTTDMFRGWKTVLEGPDAWIRYNRVDFGSSKLRKVRVMAATPEEANLEIRLDATDGPLLSRVKIPGGSDWMEVDSKLSGFQPGIHDLVVVTTEDSPVEIDWIRFIK